MCILVDMKHKQQQMKHIRVSDDIYASIYRIAKEERRTVQGETEILLEYAISQLDNSEKKN